MTLERRHVLAGAAAVLVAGQTPAQATDAQPRYGLIGRIKAQPGKRAELIRILLEGTGSMPGCLSYVVAEDAVDPDSIWITEIWDSETSHKASLALPQVRAAIGKGRPLIAGFDSIATTRSAAGPLLAR